MTQDNFKFPELSISLTVGAWEAMTKSSATGKGCCGGKPVKITWEEGWENTTLCADGSVTPVQLTPRST